MNKKVRIILIVLIILIAGVYCIKNTWLSNYVSENNINGNILYHLERGQNGITDSVAIEKYLDINNKRVCIFSFIDKIEHTKKLGHAVYSVNKRKNRFKFDHLGYTSYNFSAEKLKTLDAKHNVAYKIFIYGDNSSIKARYSTLQINNGINDVAYKNVLPYNQVFLIPINTTFYSERFIIGALEFFDENSINITLYR